MSKLEKLSDKSYSLDCEESVGTSQKWKLIKNSFTYLLLKIAVKITAKLLSQLINMTVLYIRYQLRIFQQLPHQTVAYLNGK